MSESSYQSMSRYYDAIYRSFHDFAAEAQTVRTHLQRLGISDGATVLDVACGTGLYLEELLPHYTMEGLDLSSEMLTVARAKWPELPLHQADMSDFDLGRRFDALICLGSAIGYLKTEERLRQTFATFARHLRPGGVAVIEPWIKPEHWKPGTTKLLTVDEPDLKIARISLSGGDQRISTVDFHFLIADHAEVEYATEHHELGLFPHETILTALQATTFRVEYDHTGLTNRGLYLAIHP